MSDSPRTQIGRILDDAAAADIPASLDLWPAIAAAARRLDSTTSTTGGRVTPDYGWSRPALDPAARRRATQPTTTSDDAQEQTIMSTAPDTIHDEPIPLQRRRWAREALKLVAAAVIFTAIGAILALALRDDDDTPSVGGPGPTPTPVVAPSPTTTAASPAPTPTDEPQPTVQATERVPTPIVMGTPAADLPLAGQITATIPVGVGPLAITAGHGAAITTGHGAIWVYHDTEGTLTRIDPATDAVEATITIATPLDPASPPSDLLGQRQARPDLAIDATSVWVIKPEEQAIVRIDPQTNSIVATIPLKAKATALAVDGSSLWVALFAADSIARIDTTTGEVVATVRDVPQPADISIAQGTVWVTNYWSNMVTRIDPVTNQIVAQMSVAWPGAQFPDPICGLCVADVLANAHGVWVALRMVNAVARIDPETNRLIAVIPVGIQPRSLASDARGIWVGHLSSAGVLLIDPVSNQVVAAVPATEAPNQAAWIARWENTLWVARVPTGDVARIDLQSE